MYTCRICLEESPDRSLFISPCKCSGSAKYVHRECLDKWRNQNPEASAYTRCEVCHYNYEFEHDNTTHTGRSEEQRKFLLSDSMFWEYCNIILQFFMVIVFIMFILWALAKITKGKIKPILITKFNFPPLFAYFISAIIFFIVFVVVWGYLLFIKLTSYGLIHYPGAFGLFFGPYLMIIRINNHIKHRREFYYNKYWNNTSSQRVKDFGDVGPP